MTAPETGNTANPPARTLVKGRLGAGGVEQNVLGRARLGPAGSGWLDRDPAPRQQDRCGEVIWNQFATSLLAAPQGAPTWCLPSAGFQAIEVEFGRDGRPGARARRGVLSPGGRAPRTHMAITPPPADPLLHTQHAHLHGQVMQGPDMCGLEFCHSRPAGRASVPVMGGGLVPGAARRWGRGGGGPGVSAVPTSLRCPGAFGASDAVVCTVMPAPRPVHVAHRIIPGVRVQGRDCEQRCQRPAIQAGGARHRHHRGV